MAICVAIDSRLFSQDCRLSRSVVCRSSGTYRPWPIACSLLVVLALDCDWFSYADHL